MKEVRITPGDLCGQAFFFKTYGLDGNHKENRQRSQQKP